MAAFPKMDFLIPSNTVLIHVKVFFFLPRFRELVQSLKERSCSHLSPEYQWLREKGQFTYILDTTVYGNPHPSTQRGHAMTAGV